MKLIILNYTVCSRKEIGLEPQFDYILEMKPTGSVGKTKLHADS